ncbi:MAG: HAMP domain-containing histidine kinase [Defluviitaleaceae bacterium]|nr:HAMP domain-containing histidine kinase [Defluviitaleaceae bacterium]
MKSFKFILVRNFVGMIFLVLAIVYAAFNVATTNFITTEARRELARSVANLENVAGRTMPQVAIRFRDLPALNIIEEIMAQFRQETSLRQLMMNTDGIIINQYNEVIPPGPYFINEETVREIAFLANYFINNRPLFENESLVRLAGAHNTYYLTAVNFPMPDGTAFSILLYTDISSVGRFMRNVNTTLGVLLIISGMVSIAISVLMSSRVQRAVVRLGRYAEVIGQGRFDEKVGDFDYREFNDLAQRMNNMSHKLSTYENNQKQFFQNVSHELRTPLMSIQGYAEGIAENVVDKNEAAQIILSEGERMEGLVNQLLYISRMDSGLDEVHPTSFNLQNSLYDCAERVKLLAERNGRTLVIDFPPQQVQIKTDEEKLQRVVGNLLANAIRHANQTVTLGYTFENNNVKITVVDDGAGIAQEDIPHIFERFYTGAGGNSGLGLAICKDIIGKLGGTIEVINSDAGAMFIVQLPA